jgi:hypothetical protein
LIYKTIAEDGSIDSGGYIKFTPKYKVVGAEGVVSKFFAAMSSSRSDIVTLSVRPFVRYSFSFSFSKSLKHIKLI